MYKRIKEVINSLAWTMVVMKSDLQELKNQMIQGEFEMEISEEVGEVENQIEVLSKRVGMLKAKVGL